MGDLEERIRREGRFEAARSQLLRSLHDARKDDGWFRSPGVLGRLRGREVELRFPGGPNASVVRVTVRIRMGGPFRARPRARPLRWLGLSFLALSGRPPAPEVVFTLERLLRDHGAHRVQAGQGQVRVELPWERDEPAAPDRLLGVLERLDRLALALEEVHQPRVESGGALSCPYCRAAIEPGAPVARCESCATPYHPSCFEENRGCGIYGCGSRAARSSSGRLPAVGKGE